MNKDSVEERVSLAIKAVKIRLSMDMPSIAKALFEDLDDDSLEDKEYMFQMNLALSKLIMEINAANVSKKVWSGI